MANLGPPIFRALTAFVGGQGTGLPEQAGGRDVRWNDASSVARVSGNPGGRPRQDPEVRALCEKFTPAAIATLAEIMGNKKAQPSARVAAAMAILKKTLPDLASIEHTGD